MPPEWIGRCRPLIAGGNQRISAILRELTPDDWRRPSNCEGWRVLDVPAHLAFAASYYVQAIDRALVDDLTPLWRDGVEGAYDRQRRLRRDTPEEGLALFSETAARLDEAYARIPAAELDRTAWHILSPRPLWRYVAMRVYELTLHEWDLRASLGRPATLASEPLPLLTDLLLGALLPLTLDAQASQGVDATFAFDFGESNAPHPGLRIADGVASLHETSHPAVLVCLTRQQFVLALSGRVPWPGDVQFHGDTKLGERFRSFFKPL
jgi:uncharacterized protein (TIGR03083 family)